MTELWPNEWRSHDGKLYTHNIHRVDGGMTATGWASLELCERNGHFKLIPYDKGRKYCICCYEIIEDKDVTRQYLCKECGHPASHHIYAVGPGVSWPCMTALGECKCEDFVKGREMTEDEAAKEEAALEHGAWLRRRKGEPVKYRDWDIWERNDGSWKGHSPVFGDPDICETMDSTWSEDRESLEASIDKWYETYLQPNM